MGLLILNFRYQTHWIYSYRCWVNHDAHPLITRLVHAGRFLRHLPVANQFSFLVLVGCLIVRLGGGVHWSWSYATARPGLAYYRGLSYGRP